MICDACRSHGQCYGYSHCETRELRARVLELSAELAKARAAVLEEREACARVAETYPECGYGGEFIAAAIRSRPTP